MNFIKKYIIQNFSNFTFFYTVLRSRLLIVILLSCITAILDSVGLTMFLPLLQLADGADNGVDLGNLDFLMVAIKKFNITFTVTLALIILFFVFFIKGIAVNFSSIYKLKTQQILTKQLRMTVVNKFPYFSYSQFVKTDVGQVQNIFIGEITRVSNTYNSYVSMIQGLIMLIVYMVFSLVVNWQFAILVALGGYLSNLIFSRINLLTKKKSKDLSLAGNVFAGLLIQYVQNFKYLKATGRIMDYRNKIDDAIDNTQRINFSIGKLNAKVEAFREPILMAVICLVIFLQINVLGSKMSDVLVSLLFFYRALTSIVSIQTSYNSTISNQGAIDNFLLFNKELDNNIEKVGHKSFNGFNNSIELKNITLSYDNIKILDEINLSINKNQTVAFVGESGAGKTTLINILSQLIKTNSGEYLIDGGNALDINQFDFQKKVGYISQEPSIFNDTIYNNVTFWAPKVKENFEKFEKAMRSASLWEMISNLPNQEETFLGNNGINLSGGQRQRISIARELYKDVEILILDEATSALDSTTEKDIQKSIIAMQGHLTFLIIAHRLSTIKHADVIYFMKKGKIEAYGNFDELVSKSTDFSRMVSLQNI